MPIKEEQYNLFDGINTTATRWMAYQYDKRKASACICNYYGDFNKYFLWLINIVNDFCKIYDHVFYVACPWIKYIYLRYIKHFKKVRYPRPGTDTFPLDTEIFIKEITTAFDVVEEIIPVIYDEYYRR